MDEFTRDRRRIVGVLARAKEVVARASPSSDGSRRRASSVRARVRAGTLHLHDLLRLLVGGRTALSRTTISQPGIRGYMNKFRYARRRRLADRKSTNAPAPKSNADAGSGTFVESVDARDAVGPVELFLWEEF